MSSELSDSTRLYVCSITPDCQLAMRKFRELLAEANAYAMDGNLDSARIAERAAERCRRQAHGFGELRYF